MATVTLPDGQTVTVKPDQIAFEENEVPKGFVTNQHMTDEVKRRVSSAKRNAQAELMQNDDLVRQIVEERGGELREDGTIKGATKDLKSQEAAWQAKHLTPMQAKLEESQKAIERYRSKALESSILAAAAEAGVKPAFLKPIAEGAEAPIVTMLKSSFGYDQESDSWAVRQGEGFKYGQDGKPAGAGTLMAELKSNQTFSDYFQATQMKSSNLPGNAATGKPTYTQAQLTELSKNPAEWAKAEADILAAQSEGRIID